MWAAMVLYGSWALSYGVCILIYHHLTQHYSTAFNEPETRCRKCGYILRGITEPRCSECGERI